MLAYARAAEALVASHGRERASPSASPLLASRFVHRALPLVRMHGEIVRQRDGSTLESDAQRLNRNGRNGQHPAAAARLPGAHAVTCPLRRASLGKRFTRNNLELLGLVHAAVPGRCGARPRPSAAAAPTSSRSGWAIPTRWAARCC